MYEENTSNEYMKELAQAKGQKPRAGGSRVQERFSPAAEILGVLAGVY